MNGTLEMDFSCNMADIVITACVDSFTSSLTEIMFGSLAIVNATHLVYENFLCHQGAVFLFDLGRYQISE